LARPLLAVRTEAAQHSECPLSKSVLAGSGDWAGWIRELGLRVSGQPGGNGPQLSGVSHRACLALLDLTMENLSRISLQVPKDRLLLVLGNQGQFGWPNHSGSHQHPAKHYTSLLLPKERLELPVHSQQASLLLLSCSLTKLRALALAHGLGSPDWSVVVAELPSQHSLLQSCCSQLLSLACNPLTPIANGLVQALENLVQISLVSMAGSEVCSLNVENPAHIHVAHAISFMRKHLDRSLTVKEISLSCHVSVRTLQTAFKSVCHLSPIQTLQELRLDGLRARLQMGEEVASACRAVGLKASGRIAAAYRDRYGELPRDTRIQHQLMPTDSQVKLAEVRQLFNSDISRS
jgi:AraC-like DNA-binding protein